jgi:hypothetical protein
MLKMSLDLSELFQLSQHQQLRNLHPKLIRLPTNNLSLERIRSATKTTAVNWLGRKSLPYVVKIRRNRRMKK